MTDSGKPSLAPSAVDLMTVGGTLRFGVGRSKMAVDRHHGGSWGRRTSVTSNLGPRAAFNTFNLSLHKSGIWRFAYTAEGAKRQGIVSDRLIQRYPMPPEVAPGWRVAASIMIPDSSLSIRASPEAGKVQWWPAPGKGCALNVQRMDDGLPEGR